MGAETDPIATASPAGTIRTTGSGRISSVDAAAARLYGYDADELVGQNVAVLLPPGSGAAEVEITRRVMAGQDVRPHRADRVRRDGTVVTVVLTSSPIVDLTGAVVGVATVSHPDPGPHAGDRSQLGVDAELAARGDREQLQSHLEQSQRLEVLGQLAGGVAHDFNNVLAVILNYAEFVAGELAARPGSGLESAARDVAAIQQAAERATALTHQLLAFARREVIQPRVLDLNRSVADVEQLLRRTLGADVVLHIDRAEDLWPVLADPGQLEQVLVNLAVNARDAMSGGGILTIDTANVVLDRDVVAAGSSLRAGRHVRLRVGDTGTGMPAEVAAHAFEPFYTTKADGRGTGLGLATVYGIVSQAAGAITITTQPGVGTTFTIMIPVTDKLPEPVVTPATYERTPTGETVLVVEDEHTLREVTKRIFTRSGYRVLDAADGHEALALVARYDGEIHLLVTDVVLPSMLGREIAERVSALRPDVAVLYMSGYAQPVLAAQGRLDPGIVLIEKPFSAVSLIEAAGRVLNDRAERISTVDDDGAAPPTDG